MSENITKLSAGTDPEAVKGAFYGMWQTFISLITSFGLRIIAAVIFAVIGVKVAKWLVKLLNSGKKFNALPGNAKTLINDLVKIGLYVLVGVISAAILGIEMTSIAAVVASAGLAIGLALQGSLSNLAGGIMILVFHPFNVGDFISDGTHSGTVTDIGIFYTTLKTLDNVAVTIPNGALSNTTVTDYATNKIRRMDIALGVSYSADLDLVRKVLLEIADTEEKVLKNPAPFVGVDKHAESSINLTFRVWVDYKDYWPVYFSLYERSKKAFDSNKIIIPFPQMDVHFDK